MDRLWEIFERFSDIANMDSEHIFEDFLKFLNENYVVIEK